MYETRQKLGKKKAIGKREDAGDALPRIPEPGFPPEKAQGGLSAGSIETLDKPVTGVEGLGKPGRKSTKKAMGNNAMASKEKSNAEDSVGEGATKEDREDEGGTERLENAVAILVGREYGALSQVLFTKAKQGNIGSLKLLVRLAERRKPREKPVKKPQGLSRAERLAAEPPWQGGETVAEVTGLWPGEFV